MSREHELYLKKIKLKKREVVIARIVILLGFIILWQIAADFKWIDPFLTSSPTRIAESYIGNLL